MAEEVVFEDKRGGVLVTTARFDVHGQTLALANITSVKAEYETSTVPAVIMVVLGLVLLFFRHDPQDACLFVGVGAIVLGVLVGLLGRRAWVTCVTAGGEVKVLKTRDRKYVEHVATAVRNAIVRRG